MLVRTAAALLTAAGLLATNGGTPSGARPVGRSFRTAEPVVASPTAPLVATSANAASANTASAAVTVTVIVSGVSASGGRLGAALFTSAEGFPDAPVPLSLIHPHTAAPADTFVFRNLAPGRYAVAVQHDLNGNGVVDRNLVGAPKEPWGVSRDIRHTFRAPKLEEALVEVRADTVIAVRVAK